MDWHFDIRGGAYRKKTDPETGKTVRWPEENWVWSPSGRVDMHQVETWSHVQFSDKTAGVGEEPFVRKPEEATKWALWQLYHQQRAFRKDNGYYAAQTKWLTLPEVGFPQCFYHAHAGPEWWFLAGQSKRAGLVDGVRRRVDG